MASPQYENGYLFGIPPEERAVAEAIVSITLLKLAKLEDVV